MKQGDSVVTSGMDGIYPKGFVIGTVDIVERGPGTFHKISVRPAVDFSRLEEVLVVTTLPSIKEAQGAEAALAKQPPATVTPPAAVNQSPNRPTAPGNRSPAAARPSNQTPRSPQPRPVAPTMPPGNQTPPRNQTPAWQPNAARWHSAAPGGAAAWQPNAVRWSSAARAGAGWSCRGGNSRCRFRDVGESVSAHR